MIRVYNHNLLDVYSTILMVLYRCTVEMNNSIFQLKIVLSEMTLQMTVHAFVAVMDTVPNFEKKRTNNSKKIDETFFILRSSSLSTSSTEKCRWRVGVSTPGNKKEKLKQKRPDVQIQLESARVSLHYNLGQVNTDNDKLDYYRLGCVKLNSIK